VERFQARDIVSDQDHESESMQDGSHSVATEVDKSELEWAHARGI
jgi:hypothetical protein